MVTAPRSESARLKSLNQLAVMLHQILKSDRDAVLGVGGFTGEGKSTFLSLLLGEYADIARTPWSFNQMTWSRVELMRWIDGEKGKKPLASGLKPGQLPEYSPILVDELFLLFYRRLWYEDGQIDGIATLNMCRDRHLLIAGNIPNFWDLDPGFQRRVRFYVFVPQRGVAWVFEQENNPFSSDPWNQKRNMVFFRKLGNPYLLPNFVCEVRFPDWTLAQKTAYYAVRNTKRVVALDQAKTDRQDRYKAIKGQRDALIVWCFQQHDRMLKLAKAGKKLPNRLKHTEVADACGLSDEHIRKVLIGES